MALAKYYGRAALAASQVLGGFDEQRFRSTLEAVRVGISIGADAGDRVEGRALVDLLTRLLARTYPTLVLRGQAGSSTIIEQMQALARSINPEIEFADEPTIEIVVGESPIGSCGGPRIFVGSHGWDAHVGGGSCQSVGTSENPIGPGVAACLGAGWLFRHVFQIGNCGFENEEVLSALEGEARSGPSLELSGDLGELVLVGAGAVGNAAAWTLARVPMGGTVHAVDHQSLEQGNLQRYVLGEMSDVGILKVDLLARCFAGRVRLAKHAQDFASFVASNGYVWQRMLLALDSAGDRKAAQASLPRWVANGWTQPGDLGVSCHDFTQGACVACLYLPQGALENDDAIIAGALGIPGRLMQVRTLLYNGDGIQRDLLDAISVARSLPIEKLLPFEGRPIRSLYSEGICGGALLPLGSTGTPRQEVHVPVAHQSALCGVLLAAAAVRQTLGGSGPGTQVTRVNVLQPLGTHLTQPAAKDSRDICICQDPVFREIYLHKYQFV